MRVYQGKLVAETVDGVHAGIVISLEVVVWDCCRSMYAPGT
jgi:hypothetical protein